MATTRWIDYVSTDINQALGKILSYSNDSESSEDKTVYVNWNIKKELIENEKIVLNNREIEFNYVTFSYEKIIPGNQPIEDRTTTHSNYFIIYSNGVRINYIINQKASALSFLRRMLGYSGRSEIKENGFEIESDMVIWLISKVYNSDNALGYDDVEDESEKIVIDAIKGIKGDTEDLLTKVTADGESVMNIISTLSFLLESRNLKQIKLDMKYKEHHNIELILDTKGTIASSKSSYIGEFDECENRYSCISRIYLLIYLEILPMVLQLFRDEKENDIWNEKVNIEFLKNVADDLTNKVNIKIKSLTTD